MIPPRWRSSKDHSFALSLLGSAIIGRLCDCADRSWAGQPVLHPSLSTWLPTDQGVTSRGPFSCQARTSLHKGSNFLWTYYHCYFVIVSKHDSQTPTSWSHLLKLVYALIGEKLHCSSQHTCLAIGKHASLSAQASVCVDSQAV